MVSIKYYVACLLLIASTSTLAVENRTFELPYKEWRIISLPATPPETENTLGDILGDDMGDDANYGENWVVYTYDAASNQYGDSVSLSDPLQKGRGYWVIQLIKEGEPVTLEMPQGSSVTPNSEKISLAASKNGNNQWNLAGNPFATPLKLGELRLTTTALSCSDGSCDLDKAETKELLHNKVWTYNGNNYEEKGTIDQVNPWSGFWVAALGRSKDHSLELGTSGDNSNIAVPVTGRVTSTTGTEVSGVSVNVLQNSEPQNETAITHANGTFSLDLIADTEYTLTFTADGYAKQIQRVKPPLSGGTVSLDITLIPRAAPQPIKEDATTLTGDSGASVNLTPSFKDSQGNSVDANDGVNLTIIPVDVSSPIGVASFPGDFAGVEEGQTEALPIVSYGAVEYQFTRSSDGKILQLADGNTADIQIPIYTTKYQNGTAIAADDIMPLWSLNEDTGLWVQEGTGTVVTSAESPTSLALSATVSHFTWWSVSVTMNAANAVISVNAPEAGSALIKARSIADIAWEPSAVDTVITVGDSTKPLPIPSNSEVCFRAEVSFSDGNIVTTPESCVTAAINSTVNVGLIIESNDYLTIKASPEGNVSTVINKAPLQIKIQPTTLKTNVSYAIESGALPAGVSLRSINDTTAVISGAPTEVGTFDFAVKGTDANNNHASVSINYAIRALNKTEAQDKIAAYAEDETNLAPTVQDYATAGVTGVTAENFEVVNAAVAAKDRADVTSLDELKIVVAAALGETNFSGGDGTADNPYQITSCEQLQHINDKLSADFILSQDIDCSDTVNWNNGAGFEPIGGNDLGSFSGNLDGQHYTISTLFINRFQTDFVALFGRVNGNIKNLVLADVNISGVSNKRGTGNHADEGVGAVAGDLRGTITNVTVLSGRITASNIAGGLVGEVYGDDSVFIQESSSAASVNVDFSGGDGYAHRVFAGGLVGKINSGSCDTGPDGPDIRKSYSTGDVNVSVSDSIGIRPSIGGLVGTLVAGTCGGDIIDSYSSSSIDVVLNNAETYSEGLRIGGLTGHTYESVIRNSYAIGEISYTVNGSQPTIKVGGLVADGSTRDIVYDSYWDNEATNVSSSSLGTGKTTPELQMPTSATGIYANWSPSIWRFGSSSQYPQLIKDGDPNSAEVALAKIVAYAEDNSNPAPTAQDYATAGVTGVTAENLEAVNLAIAAKDRGEVDSVAKIDAIVASVAPPNTTVSTTAELRAALRLAESNGKSDTIVLAKGIYKTTDDGGGTFSFISTEDYNLTIKSASGLSRDDVILDGDNINKVFDFDVNGKTVNINKITISNGNSNTDGGGIKFGDGTIIIRESNISHNKSIAGSSPYANGGGIYTDDGNIEVYNSTISNNSVDNGGGGLFTYNGSIILVDSILESNQARFGGGLWVYEGDLRIVNSSLISNHSTSYGGGALMFDGNVYVSNSGFYNNRSDSSNGGGLLIQGNTDSFNQEAIIVNTVFANNSCKTSEHYEGGGFYSRRNKTLLINTTFVGNSDDGFAGQGVLINNIFDDNLADIQLEGESHFYNNFFNSTNVINPTNIVTNEHQINASTNSLIFSDNEYRLPSDGITIDKGLNLESDTFKDLFTSAEYEKVMHMMQTDKDGKSRVVNNVDLGAYEVN